MPAADNETGTFISMSTAMTADVRQAHSIDDVLAALAKTDFMRLSSSEITTVYRRLQKLRTTSDLRIAYQGNHTIEPLPGFLGVRCACERIVTTEWTGEFNQYMQEVLRKDSDLVAFEPDLILLSLDIRDLAPRVHHQLDALDVGEKHAEIDRIVAHVKSWADAAKATTRATLLIANWPSPGYLRAGIADLKARFGEREFFARLNLALFDALRDDLRAHVLDLDRVAGRTGTHQAFSEQMYFLARMPWDTRLLPHVADEMYRYVHALLGRTKKCLVLDLDNTLWGGVLGEEGVDGVEVGPGTPRGEAHAAFQHAILALKRKGIILALSSKNNPDDVHELFAQRSMPLKENDFAVREINWEHKHDNLRRIAQELNIGLDSLVFVDDNPAECEIVRQMLPMVEVLELPRDPADYAGLLLRHSAFETFRVTGEDRVKAGQYLDHQRRTEQLEATGSLEDYLASLETRIAIRPATAKDAARVHQLFTKTNQFNLTTKRYNAGDVEHFLNDSRFDCRVVDVRDRFGDLGTVGLVLVDRATEEPLLDSFIMSCRAMGREVETAIMNRIKTDYLHDGPYAALLGVYAPTKKNTPVTEFYARQGFEAIRTRETGETVYRLAREHCHLIDCLHITIDGTERP